MSDSVIASLQRRKVTSIVADMQERRTTHNTLKKQILADRLIENAIPYLMQELNNLETAKIQAETQAQVWEMSARSSAALLYALKDGANECVKEGKGYEEFVKFLTEAIKENKVLREDPEKKA